MDIMPSDIFQAKNTDDLVRVLHNGHDSELDDKIRKKCFEAESRIEAAH